MLAGNPRNWTFQGFGDSGWVTLDTRSGETGWTAQEDRFYEFENPLAYSLYRLNISANNGHSDTAFLEIDMFEDPIGAMGPIGAQGPVGPIGPQGVPGVSNLEILSNTYTLDLPNGTHNVVSEYCASPKKVIGGGCWSEDFETLNWTGSNPQPSNQSWECRVKNTTGATYELTITIYVICADF